MPEELPESAEWIPNDDGLGFLTAIYSSWNQWDQKDPVQKGGEGKEYNMTTNLFFSSS